MLKLKGILSRYNGIQPREYNPFQHQDQTNFVALHAQEFTHMNNIVFLPRLDLTEIKKKKKKKKD